LEHLAAVDQITIGSIGAKLTPTGRERLTDLLALERKTVDQDVPALLAKNAAPLTS
jgi:hypothetical protein